MNREMAAHTTDGLLVSGADFALVHRRVVRVGAAASWLVATLHLVGGILGGDRSLILEAVAPGVAAAFMTSLVILKRENGIVAMVGAGLAMVGLYPVQATDVSLVPVALSLVVIATIGALLVASHQLAVSGVVAVALMGIPQLWDIDLDDALHLGLVMGLGFLVTSAIFLTIRSAAAAMSARYLTAFENSPTAVLEEDWSEAVAYVGSEYSGRSDRVLPFLLAYPQVVRRAVSRMRVVRVNQAAVELLEAESGSDLIGPRVGGDLSNDEIESYARAIAAIYEGKAGFSNERPVTSHRGRKMWVQVRGTDTPSREPHASILVGLGDVTHLKARHEAMADLVRAKDDFIAKVSHELRTPLTAVLGLTTEMTDTDAMSDDERNELMNLVADQAVEMSLLIEDLLVASRAEIGTIPIDRRAVDIQAEILAVMEGVGLRLEDLPRSMPVAIADPGRVRQIIRNLLTNARRYGGPSIRVLGGQHDDRVWLEVRDNGDGVPESLARVIFEPYSRAHSGVEGSVGLGLSVSRHLAELMGGSLGYRRDRHESVFRLELPLAGSSGRPLLASQMADV